MLLSRKLMDKIANIFLPIFTISGFLLTSLKLPQWGLAFNLSSEIFWLYSSYWAWREAKQIGIFITTIVITIILIGGVVNYWLF